jgi:hypothetical protein
MIKEAGRRHDKGGRKEAWKQDAACIRGRSAAEEAASIAPRWHLQS